MTYLWPTTLDWAVYWWKTSGCLPPLVYRHHNSAESSETHGAVVATVTSHVNAEQPMLPAKEGVVPIILL